MLKTNKWITFKNRPDSSLAGKILEPWENNKIYNDFKSDKRIFHCLLEFLGHAISCEGDVAEFGVYQGKTALLMAEFIAEKKTLHLFDTFKGMPKTNEKDNYWQYGDFSDTSYKIVENKLRNIKNKKIYEGLFQETVELCEVQNFCFVHIDADIYNSVLFVTQFVYEKISKGGIIIFDDYGDLISKGAKIAVDEFFADKPEKVIYLPTKQAIIIKL